MRFLVPVFLFLLLCQPLISIAAPAQRIVALAPSLAELTCDLGAKARLVGRTMHSETPETIRALPVVGAYSRPDVERIMALRPDLCLAIHDGTPRTVIRRLHQLGVPVLELAPDTFEGLIETLLSLGRALGTEMAAERAADLVRARLAAMDRQVCAIPDADRRVVLLQVQALPPMFAGPDTFCGELIRRAGGRNPIAGPLPYPLLNVEEVIALRPDVILIPDMARAHEAQALWRRFPDIPAVRHNRLYIVAADPFSQPTLRSLDALETLHTLLYPGQNGQHPPKPSPVQQLVNATQNKEIKH